MAPRIMKRALLLASFVALACIDGPSGVGTTAPPAKAEPIDGMPGPEDLVVDRSLGPARLLVSSRDRRKTANPNGIIFQVSLDAKHPRKSPMPITWHGHERVFRPQGMALLGKLLFVANQGDDRTGASVDVFRIEADKLQFHERIHGPHIIHPNDLDVRPLKNGKYELFVTNPVDFRKTGAVLWERFIGPQSSFVARMTSGEGESRRIGGLRYANGVAVHPDGSVYVSSTFDERVFRYGPGAAARNEVDIDALVDNLTIDGQTLLVTASTSAWKFIRHAAAAEKGKRELSPTVVWRIRPGERPVTTRLFEDDGKRISGGSSAVCVNSDLFIGQVYGDFILRVVGACAKGRHE